MKKLLHTQRRGLALWLLTLMCLASVSVWGQETKVIDFSNGLPSDWSKTGTVAKQNYAGKSCTQLQTAATIKSPVFTEAFSSVKIHLTRSSNGTTFTFSYQIEGNEPVEIKTYTASDVEKSNFKDYEIEIPEAAQVPNCQFIFSSEKASYYIYSLTFTPKASSTTQCSAPTFSPASGTSFANTLTVTASTATEGGKIVYTTDPEATLDANSPEFPSEGLTIDATTTIRAITVDPNGVLENSSEVSATYTKLNLTKSVYKKITSIDEISIGATYVIINESNNTALGFIDEDGHGNITNTYLQDGFARFDTENNNENPYEIVLSEGTDGNYILETIQGQIGYESSTSFAINKNTNWNISFTRDGNASITNINGNREIRYNSNTNDFRLYTSDSGTLKVQLYKKVAFNLNSATKCIVCC